ncbi:MAG TPA: site-2 protease family protein [Candidatus Binatia bacterium]
METVQNILIWALPVVAAIVFHEVAHGWVANSFGDSTAGRMGRLTLNPIAHIDLFGTILLPAVLIVTHAPFVFGYAKPVPVNFNNLKHPKRDMVLVALAGPVTNILLAVASAYFLKLIGLTGTVFAQFSPMVITPLVLMAQSSISINVMLAAFNLFPVPPLDGGRVLVGLLPEPFSSTVARVERFGFLIIIILLMTDILDVLIRPIVRLVLEIVGALVID